MKDIININGAWHISDEIDNEIVYVKLDEDITYKAVENKNDKRTVQQNNSIWLLFTRIAKMFNDAGITKKQVHEKFKDDESPWSKESVKGRIWDVISDSTTGKISSKELTKKELQEVYKYFHYFLSTRIGITDIEFPSVESMIFEKQLKEQQ